MKTEELADRDSVAAAEKLPDLAFTGERIVPGKTAEPLFREHEERYVFAGRYVEGKDVLDVACGSGIGTSFLREAGARSAYGLDIDPEAIAFAKARYRNCEFAQSEATSLCLRDNSMDVVVSFETLEHLKDQRMFLSECRRVLRPGGLLICSTPNSKISGWGPSNPFHVREFHPAEFRDLMYSVFPSTQLFAQENRALFSYVIRKVARRTLERLQLLKAIDRVFPQEPVAERFREEFANSASAKADNICPYKWRSLCQPIFLVAVGRKAS